MSRYLPIALGVLVIVGLTIPQIQMTDRFGETNISAQQKAKLLENVPRKIGDWVGEDMAVDPTVAQTAGAQGAISRQYRNIRTGEKVDLWLIVGHARPISAHTPDICYRASGFEMRAVENSLYPMEFEGVGSAPFWTNTFVKNDITGRRLVRVFWSWHNPHDKGHEGEVVWEAPPNARMYFGNTRALYKMYFTSEMRDASETTEQSSCLRFAREFLPVVNKALAAAHNESSDPASDLGLADDIATEKASDQGDQSVDDEDSTTDLFGDESNETTAAGDEAPGDSAPATDKPSEVAVPATE